MTVRLLLQYILIIIVSDEPYKPMDKNYTGCQTEWRI